MRAKELYLHTSNRIESLAERLVEVSREQPLKGVLDQETVMTLNPGMARWLRFEIAKSLGVSIGWDFPFPGKLFQSLLSGFDSSHLETGQFDENHARWELFDVLDNLEDRSEFNLLKRYCEPSSAKRLQLANKLAWLFDQYLLYRPDAITDWESGRSPNAWQAEIWRRLRERIFPKTRSPKHIARIWQELRTSHQDQIKPDSGRWPSRISVFGVSSLPPLYLDILEAVAWFRPVHLFLLQPSDLYWADLKSAKQIARASQRQSVSRPEPDIAFEDTTYDIGNPLLPSLGKQGQGFLDLILDKDPIHDDGSFSEPDRSTQLGCLQSDLLLLENRSGGEVPQYPFPARDGSLQIHRSASARREIETLWDYLLEYFAENPHTQASNVLVMAPDIQEYAGHIESVFSSSENDGPSIPFSIADQSGQQESTFISGAIAYLELSMKRVSALDIIELLKHPITSDVFRFSDSDLDRIEYWIRESGVVWGWDAAHRSSFNAFPTDRNTWSEFRTRLSAGMAFRDSERLLPGDYSPFCEIEGDSAELAGRFLEFLDFLEELKNENARSESIAHWNRRLCAALDRLKPREEIELNRFHASIESIQEALPGRSEVLANGREAVSCVVSALKDANTLSGYLSGRVTFCSLKPMRSIPAKVVCLLGMDNDTFPRKNVRAPFDLLAQSTRRGDRNTRDEDKQFFLETLLAARDRLFISYKGLAPSSDVKREPSIVVSELLDYLEKSDPSAGRSGRIVAHKRQSYDPEYFRDRDLYTYSKERADNCQAYLNRSSSTRENSNRVEDSSEPTPDGPSNIPIDSFIRFFKDPQKDFARTVLGARFTEYDDAPAQFDALKQDGLDKYKLQERFAEAIQYGQPIGTIEQTLVASIKLLPPGHLERLAFAKTREQALKVEASRANEEPPVRYERLSIDLEIGSHRIMGQFQRGRSRDKQFFLHPGEWKAKARLDIWIRHLLANAIQPQTSCAESLSESEKRIELPPIGTATAILEDLLSIYLQGRCRPLPFFPQLSWDALEKLGKKNGSFDEEEYLSISKSLFAKDSEKAQYTPSYRWDVYARTCFEDEPPMDGAYSRLSRDIWSPYRDALIKEGVR